MASHKSYSITLSNNKTEKEALDFLLSRKCGFVRPDKKGRKEILHLLRLPASFARTFDLLWLPGAAKAGDHVDIRNLNQFTLVEVKSTKKKLPKHPAGFFFGATKNEFDLAKRLGNKFRFCFVCLHPNIRKYSLMTLGELNRKIKTKRVQYQINL